MDRTAEFVVGVFFMGYQWLRKVFAPAIPWIFPRYFPQWLTQPLMIKVLPERMIEDGRVLFITANVITIFRTVLIIPISILLQMGYVNMGFTLYVIGGILDFVDGLVATVHRKAGYKDNPDLGAFLDAFCDKFYYGVGKIVVLSLGNYEQPLHITILLLASALILLQYEVRLGIIRVADYYYNTKNSSSGLLDLRAKGSGKLKFALEMIGIGGLILALPSFSGWSVYVGTTCLVIAIPFARQSLLGKLKQREPT